MEFIVKPNERGQPQARNVVWLPGKIDPSKMAEQDRNSRSTAGRGTKGGSKSFGNGGRQTENGKGMGNSMGGSKNGVGKNGGFQSQSSNSNSQGIGSLGMSDMGKSGGGKRNGSMNNKGGSLNHGSGSFDYGARAKVSVNDLEM